jgi:ribonuclease BN (tRNA processing enzyme)
MSPGRAPAARIERVLLTHFHSDHIDGLGPIGLQRWVQVNASQPLILQGPVGVGEVAAGFNAAYRIDSGYRTGHHGAATSMKIDLPSALAFSNAFISKGHASWAEAGEESAATERANAAAKNERRLIDITKTLRAMMHRGLAAIQSICSHRHVRRISI